MNELVACSMSTQIGTRENGRREALSRTVFNSGSLLMTDTYALLRTQDFNINFERKSYRYIRCYYETIYTEPDVPK